jgi:hypothetical protein
LSLKILPEPFFQFYPVLRSNRRSGTAGRSSPPPPRPASCEPRSPLRQKCRRPALERRRLRAVFPAAAPVFSLCKPRKSPRAGPGAWGAAGDEEHFTGKIFHAFPPYVIAGLVSIPGDFSPRSGRRGPCPSRPPGRPASSGPGSPASARGAWPPPRPAASRPPA